MVRPVAPAPLPRLRGAMAHAAAGVMVVATSVVLTALAIVLHFLGLFVVAILFDQPLGSPVAFPAWLIIGTVTAGIFSLSASLLVLFPATLAARAICSRVAFLSRLRPWTEIPTASLATLLLGGIAGGALHRYAEANLEVDSPYTLLASIGLGWPLLLPLGLYWWTLTFSRFGLGTATKAGKAVLRKVRSVR